MIPDDFAEIGFHAKPRSRVRITRYQVIGERSSGTNFVKRLIARNTDLKHSEALGWKHGFPGAQPVPQDLAVICMVRDAESWACSMHAKPWHTSPAMQGLRFDRFIRAQWDSVFDHPRYFKPAWRAGVPGGPLLLDRDPETGAAFSNLFALRLAKLYGLLSYLERDCSMVLLRMETAQAEPEAVIDAMRVVLGQRLREDRFRPVTRRLGAKFSPAIDARPPTPRRIGPKGIDFMRRQLDLRLEQRLGYSYGAAP
ncbi:hypothetical protein [Sulfitobacter sabulilitoris]|uniref:Sulfotransferase family protein n=1 Tax=Sulfitobacter sabulilitoris TaxID=2562655 RepID=A0A5S3PJB6_9RHOB|nr:hypothetical protein [Sulfitobacter sabulilitoris]TMM54401.1 hypothetical protein FDT80_02065 [Sulfitobacter sabulilitoris]